MGLGHKLHHRDVVRVALRRLESELDSEHSKDVLQQVLEETGRSGDRES